MITHIVLFKWKPEATDEQIAAAMEALHGLSERISGIASLSSGKDFSGRAQGYTHALVVRFADRASFDAYGPHPEHQAVVESRIFPVLADALEFDYEVPSRVYRG